MKSYALIVTVNVRLTVADIGEPSILVIIDAIVRIIVFTAVVVCVALPLVYLLLWFTT